MWLFIAIEFPDEVKSMLGRLRADIPGARWVPMEQLHLTLSFLGDVDDTAMKRLTEELAAIKAPCFRLRFSGTGCFPGRRRSRVLWIGLEPEPLLSSLASLVRNRALSCNIPQEERPFSPHITLARLKEHAPRKVAAFLDQPIDRELPDVSVREFILFQSLLTPKGAVHTPIKSFSLMAADA